MAKRKKILVADISQTVRRLIANYLKDDYDVVEAETGSEILSIVDKNHAGGSNDLEMVLLCQEFPDYNALEIVKRIRKKYDKKSLPIIFSTSNNNRETMMEALEKGINDFILKPFHKELLISKIHKLEREIPLHDLKLSQLIAKIPFFSGVPEAQVAFILKSCSETVTMEKGGNICEEGDDGRDMFILLEGKCDVLFNKRKVAEINPVDTIGEMGFITSQKRSATVTASEPSKVIVLKKEPFEEYLNEERGISELICKNIILSLNERIRKSNDMIKKLKILAEDYLSY